jgi:hypothetical protein
MIDTVRVVGRNEPVELHEVLGEAGQVNGEHDGYSRAMDLYRARRWREARIAFEQISDPPAATLAGRCAAFIEQDPGPTWDGVWVLDRK